MQYYFIHTAAGQEGPLTLPELKAKNITKDTLVWNEALPDWVEAGEVEELKILFITGPPPLKEKRIVTAPPSPKDEQIGPPPIKDQSFSQTVSSKKKYRSILLPAFILFVLVFAAFFYFNKSSKSKDKEKLIAAIGDSSFVTKKDTLTKKDTVDTDTLKLINLDTFSNILTWDTASQTNNKANDVVETSGGIRPFPYFIDTKKTKEKKKKNEKDKTTNVQEKNKPEELREEGKPAAVKEIDATDFLSVRGSFHKNLLLEAVLEGTISNRNPSIAFRDVIVEAKFVDAEGSVIEVKNYTQNNVVQGGQSIPFKFKTRASKGAKSVRFGIVNAKSVM